VKVFFIFAEGIVAISAGHVPAVVYPAHNGHSNYTYY
jgi:hypothetical protein